MCHLQQRVGTFGQDRLFGGCSEGQSGPVSQRTLSLFSHGLDSILHDLILPLSFFYRALHRGL
jgi:hypothetical protein